MCMLQGHGSTIEDVVFKPGSKEQLASVGDDQCLLLWDTRSGNAPANRVAQVWLRNSVWLSTLLSV
jgi:histone-binding protein RBBP4